VNASLPDGVVYGEVCVKGFGSNVLSREVYHNVGQYLVRMGFCSINRDMSVWNGGDTKKPRREQGDNEVHEAAGE